MSPYSFASLEVMNLRAQAHEHTPDEMRGTLLPIAQILTEGHKFDDAATVVREWCGVSDASDARDAFIAVLEASPGVESLEFSMDTKRHWRHKLDRGAFDRIVALAVDDRRRSAVLRINFSTHEIGGARLVMRRCSHTLSICSRARRERAGLDWRPQQLAVPQPGAVRPQRSRHGMSPIIPPPHESRS